METKTNLSWLCISKYLPERNINIINEMLLKSGVAFFNLHHMEKGYFPTSLIKFQVDETKTDISYLTNKNFRIGDRDYTIRRYLDQPRQHYRYRYVKPHPQKLFRKQATNVEKLNIETNYQKTLAEYASLKR